MDSIQYRFYAFLYKVALKLKLWGVYHGVDEETGVPYATDRWFWQDKEGLSPL